MAKSAFINDGFTRNGFLKETDFYDACRFQYRPVTVAQRVAIRDKISRETSLHGADAGERVVNAWIATRVLKWDVTDQGGHAVPITADNCGGLEPNFASRLFAVLIGDALCDPDPVTGDRPADEDQALKN